MQKHRPIEGDHVAGVSYDDNDDDDNDVIVAAAANL